MSNESPAFDESMFQWETKTSSRGVPFRLGWEKAATDSVIKTVEAADGMRSKPTDVASATGGPKNEDFGIDVNWPVEGRWMTTSKTERETSGISEYKLQKGGGLFYDYTLQFRCFLPYDYYFFDETGDSYEVNVYRVGQHNVQYKSKKPVIIFVKGS